MVRRLVAALVGVGALAGCGEGGGGAPAATVRDSAGIEIVENVYPDSAEVPWWTLDAAPVVDIGGVDAEEAYALYQVGDALRLSDGRIVVTNAGSSDVRYFSADGTHLRTTGREGEGPGEFRRPQRLFVMPGDSVLVVESFGGRASVLDPDGAFARDFQLGGTGPGVGVVGRMSDGTFIATRNTFTGGEIVNGFQRPDIAFVTLTPAGEVHDTIVSLPGAEATVRMQGTRDQIQSIEIVRAPFSKATVFAAAGDVLAVATQDEPEIRVYGTDGVLRRLIRTGSPMPPVTEEHLEAWFQRQREGMPEELRAQAVRRPDWPNAGKVVPPYAAVELDDAGNLWVLDYDDRIHPAGDWSVHDPEGRLIARIRMPDGFRLLHIGSDFVLGVERDDLDVEHVRMYRIQIAP